MRIVETSAHARVGLLGNPSDIYGGRGIGFALADLGLDLRLEESREVELQNELLAAGWRVLQREEEVAGPPFRATIESTIPYQCGLAGSSAILIAALRAWSIWFDRPLSSDRMAELAWRTEAEELGIRAGPLDRLVQAHAGLVFMDCARAFEPEATTHLDPGLLPRFVLAWDPDPGEASGSVHSAVHERWQRGDGEVRAVMEELAEIADAGRAALEAGDLTLLRELVNRNFDLRASLFDIEPRDRRMIEIGRERGAATKFCGSGGSVLALPASVGELERLRRAYQDASFLAITPVVARPR